MKFIVEQAALTDGVNWVSRSLSTRPIKTELLGIVIEAINNEVFLSASDLETASKAHFPADNETASFFTPFNTFPKGCTQFIHCKTPLRTGSLVFTHSKAS